MDNPSHLLRLQPSPSHRDSEAIHIVVRNDVQWGTPLFRAPALPTPHQVYSDLPFTVNFRGKPRTQT